LVVGVLGINLFWGFLKCHSGCCCLSIRRACVKAISRLLHCNWLLLYNGKFFYYNAQSFFYCHTHFLSMSLSVCAYLRYLSVCLAVCLFLFTFSFFSPNFAYNFYLYLSPKVCFLTLHCFIYVSPFLLFSYFLITLYLMFMHIYRNTFDCETTDLQTNLACHKMNLNTDLYFVVFAFFAKISPTKRKLGVYSFIIWKLSEVYWIVS